MTLQNVRPESIINLQVDSAWTAQRPDEARRNAKTAKILNIAGFVIGFFFVDVIIIIVIIYMVIIP